MHSHPDVIVIGAGIVGAACALSLQKAGMQTLLIDAAMPGCGVTAAGMGHLVALDESEQELDLCLYSLQLWRDWIREHPGIGQVSQCGTLWVAENEQQLAAAQARAARLNARAWQAEVLNSEKLRQLEPALRHGLAGAVRVFGDSVVYPPVIAYHLAQELQLHGGKLQCGLRVNAILDDVSASETILFEDGQRLSAQYIVVAAGLGVAELLPEIPVFPRKGHLAITDRYPGRLQHQIVSMDYGQHHMTPDGLSVAANIQPRSTGQWLIGSSRQDGQTDTTVSPVALGAVLQSAIRLLPCLATMNVIRAWAGMRPASPDGQPIIGVHPERPGIWLAAGHEGLGVTTSFATAEILKDLILDQMTSIDSTPYSPSRLFESKQYA
ncbi:NAD(P)/FAD-dependent oxidoreductase [Undibacterium sp. Dicai25W]|uniref:NAD(P)/FAD-dependent oxidoreductase n=1 Tax=Undibacterium sp. Dicai25W TaxID=3413034 RepID=UPI003BF00A18